jgi:Domain of unknown function (DUF4387)
VKTKVISRVVAAFIMRSRQKALISRDRSHVADAEIVNRAAIASLYNRDPAEIIVINHDTALAIKVSFPHPQSSGSKHDSDVYGGSNMRRCWG